MCHHTAWFSRREREPESERGDEREDDRDTGREREERGDRVERDVPVADD